MRKSKVIILKEKIAEAEAMKNELKLELKRICKHKNIKYKSYCTDDWDIPEWYQDSYCCLDCELHAYSPEYSSEYGEVQKVSKDFEVLYKKYWRNIGCSEYRLNSFDTHYIIVDDT